MPELTMEEETAQALAVQNRMPSMLKGIVTQDNWDAKPNDERVAALLNVLRGKKAVLDVPATSSERISGAVSTQNIPAGAAATGTPGPATASGSLVPAGNGGALATRPSGLNIPALAQLPTPPTRLPIATEDWDRLTVDERIDWITILMEELEISMNDVRPDFPKITMPTAGGLQWKMPDGTSRDEITGIVIWSSQKRAWWKSSEITNSLPDCSADNGRVPNSGKGPTGATTCAACPNSQFGSGKEGRGQACKTVKDVFLWQEGQQVPYHVPLPPTSLKPFDAYVTGSLNASPSRPLSTIVTSMKLVMRPGKNYAIVHPTSEQPVPFQVTAEVRKIRSRFIDAMTRRGITEDDVKVVDQVDDDAGGAEDGTDGPASTRTDKDRPRW